VQALRHALPAIGLALTLTLGTLLALYTRSVIAPCKTIAVALLTMGAALGMLVTVFQDGHGRALLQQFTLTGTLDCSLLLFVLVLTLAISLDYEIFLLGRIKEEYDRHHDNQTSIIEGISRTGSLMTAAALSVAIPTAALAATGVTALKIIGLGVALTVLVDAVLVRGFLVPATMAVLGALNWWNPLHRTHRSRSGRGAPPSGGRGR
uniref:MMPL family transporter n=1 Tax=Streptomyces flavofungini TaxID=68200 RepID=UPI0034E00B54